MKIRFLCLMALGSALILNTMGNLAFAEDPYTDEMIQSLFKKSETLKVHRIMSEQRDRLRRIMDGFLTGDIQGIQQNADELSSAMQSVAFTLPSTAENNAEVWKAMSGVVTESQLLKEEISKKDYQKAYSHYSQLMGRCIQCHQVARVWGKFDEIKVETPSKQSEEKNTQESKDQTRVKDHSVKNVS